MLAEILTFMLACNPRPNLMCTREYMPVCGNGTTFNNICLAQRAGFHGHCSVNLHVGECIHTRVICESHQFLSEKGFCVKKPWDDFESCEIEKKQGACPQGNDPNPFVGEHCAVTCGVYTKTTRQRDGA